MRNPMLLRILKKSLGKRKTRVGIAVVSVIMGAAMISALLTVSMQVEEKVGYELSNFGPNLILFPKSKSIQVSVGGVELGTVTEQQYIKESDLEKVEDLKYSENVRGIRGIAPYLFTVVDVNNDSQVVMAGTWFDQVKNINTWWSIEGKWIDDRNDTISSIVGITVSEKLNLNLGDTYKILHVNMINDDDGNITIIETERNFEVSGVLNAGSEDDERIFVNLDVLQNITEQEDKVSMIQVTALCNKCPTEVIAAEVEASLPNIEAKTVKQVADTQMQILDKIESMMILITIVTLMATALGVMTTMTTSVVERTKEIGMMKAIGAEGSKVATLFLTEALIIGILGGIAGYVVGIVIAQYIGQSVFQSAITPNLIVLPLIIGISIGITIISSIIPVRRAIKIEPAEVLRAI
jgi:putative ABC transport system permease protein